MLNTIIIPQTTSKYNPEPHSNSKSKLFSHVKIDPGLAGVLEEGGANADADNAETDGAIDACFILAVCCC